MAIQRSDVLRVLESADHPLGLREILKLGGFHPGQQTDLKRVLRDLVRRGAVVKVGKRFEPPGGPRVSAPEATKGGTPRAQRGRERATARGRDRGQRRGPPRPGVAPVGRDPGRPRRAEPSFERGRAGRAQDVRQRQRGLEGLRRREAIVEGVLHVHRDGYGFVHPLVPDRENIYLPPDEAARALDGDRVLVEVIEGRGGRTMGMLIEVVDRVRQRAVGEYRREGRHAFVIPQDPSLSGIIRVPPTQLARPGDLVKVVLGIGNAVLEPGTALHGEVVGVVGRPGEPSAEVLSIAYANGFSDEFPEEVMREADRFGVSVREEEARAEGRRDLRNLPLLTIDGEDARDFDDAVYAEPTSGGWRLVVAIADVSHYVREGSALDAEALRRGTSVYLPDRVLPMLPERLSNGICSLRPEEDRLCMVADLQFDRRAKLQSFELYPGVMRSVARCTYNEVQDVLDGKDVPHRNVFRPHFENLMTLARALRAMRRARGAIDFDLPEYRVILDDDGAPLRLEKRERKDSHRLIEECMLAANEAVARFFRERDLPSVYRFHSEPDEEKLAVFAQLARVYGFDLGEPSGISPHDLNRFLEQMAEHPERRALNQLLLRAMMQAVYSAENVGHYGLGAEHYLHFTSPIRRYPDLIVHRLLKQHWVRGGRVPTKAEREAQEEALEALAVQSSERERAAVAVEREVIAYYQTLLMKDRIGEEFEATVSSLTDFGFFVELDEVHVEGLVRSESVGVGAKLDTALHAIVWRDGRRLRVGQAVRVRLISANVERRQLEFEAVSIEGHEAGRAEGAAPPSPHPGFDRLRALAAKRGGGARPGGKAGRGEGLRDRKGPSGAGGRRVSKRGGGVTEAAERDRFGNPRRPANRHPGGRKGSAAGGRKRGAAPGGDGGRGGGRRSTGKAKGPRKGKRSR